MEFVYEKIHVPEQHSFITRRLPLQSKSRIHSHKNFELNYIHSGSGRRIVGDNISSFAALDLVLLGPNLPHSWEVSEDQIGEEATCIVTHFSEDIVKSDFFNMPELVNVLDLLKKAGRGMHFIIKDNSQIIKYLDGMTSNIGLDYYIGLLNVFSHLLKVEDRHVLSNPNNIAPAFSNNLEKINKVYEYVFLNIQSGVKLKEASAVLHMAPSSFCRFFKKKTNETFMEYVKSVRIGIAAKLLTETNKQVTQICYESGYNNLANFNHYFKISMGKTPSEYRNSFK